MRYEEDARLTILRELAEEKSHTLNETMLRRCLKAFGINRPRSWVREQLIALEDRGAITITRAGTVFVAVLTETGEDHLGHSNYIDGISIPTRR